MAAACIRLCLICLALGMSLLSARADDAISADNLHRLRSAARVDFADLPGEIRLGWFEANHDASQFILFDQAGRIYRLDGAGLLESWSYRQQDGQLFSLIDAAFVDDSPFVLYLLDDAFYINATQLLLPGDPVALHALAGQLAIEVAHDGGLSFQLMDIEPDSLALTPGETLAMPGSEAGAPAVRIGRVDFPQAIISHLADGALTAYRYPEAFTAETGRRFKLPGGPAVAGAVNASGTHFAWSDPAAARLNLLDLQSGSNQVVAELNGAYAQYHLLSADASAILVVNLDFAPAVFAWDIASGLRHELGEYRACKRIPDKVALSGDGTALIIGCDSGLDIWRVGEDQEN